MLDINPVTPDDYKLQRTLKEDRKRIEAEKRRVYLEETMNNSPVLSDDGILLSDEKQQAGTPLSPKELEIKLLRLCPALHFKFHPNNKTKKALYHKKPDNTLEFICAYENRVMPEHSVMRVVEHEYPDPEVFTKGRTIQRDELPAFEVVVDSKSPIGYSYEFDPTARRPGMIYVNKGFGEQTRGWRTVLLRLIQHNLITVNAAEKEFRSDNRAEWAKWSGKLNDAQATW